MKKSYTTCPASAGEVHRENINCLPLASLGELTEGAPSFAQVRIFGNNPNL